MWTSTHIKTLNDVFITLPFGCPLYREYASLKSLLVKTKWGKKKLAEEKEYSIHLYIKLTLEGIWGAKLPH